MNFDSYKNTLRYPLRKDFTRKFVYKGGKLVATISPHPQNESPVTVFESGVTEIPENAVVETELDDAAHKLALAAYHAAEQAVTDKFANDLFADLGIANNPRRHVLFAKAWERGHSSGLQEIYNVACDLVELIE